jgi:DNA-binding transcriptional regulator YhcF (GntR family)
MKSLNISVERTSAIYRQIERDLRARIESGSLAAGTPLPPAAEIARQAGVHVLTVQKALRKLKQDGLIDRTPRIGSFVRGPAQAPAIALLFGPSLSDEHTHFYRALMRTLQADSAGHWLPRVYDGLQFGGQGQTPDPHNAFPALQKDSERIAFKGAIVSGIHSRSWERIPSLAPLPVAWLGRTDDGADLGFDFAHFTQTALSWFAERQRRRVVYFRTFGNLAWARPDLEAFHAATARHGFEHAAVHDLDALYQMTYREQEAFRQIAAVIRNWDRDGWPDAVLVSDDVVMRAVALALLKAPRRSEAPPLLLTLANEAVRLHYGLPTARYVIPTAYCARRLREILDSRMGGRNPPGLPERVRGTIAETE